jgi:hypothetical protein
MLCSTRASRKPSARAIATVRGASVAARKGGAEGRRQRVQLVPDLVDGASWWVHSELCPAVAAAAIIVDNDSGRLKEVADHVAAV